MNYSDVSLHLNLRLKVDYFHSMAHVQDIEYITRYTAQYITVLNKGENWQRPATDSPAPINLAPGWCYN